MTLGDALLVAGALLALVGLAAGLWRPRWLLVLVAATAALLTAALALLAVKFLQPDLTTFYVWSEASGANPWYYRLAGLWASQPGTLLLWAWYTSLGALALALLHRKRGHDATRLALLFALGIVALFALYAWSLRLFSSTEDWRIVTLTNDGRRLTDWIYAPGLDAPTPLQTRPGGNSLNPLLLSPFMVIHPWLEFAAYAAAGLAWSVALGMLLARAEDDRDALWPWARLAWTLYTVAITLGALWAYYTLSFGGYWAWDPVETANLIPWIVLTALLHTRPSARASLATPALACAAFALTLFSTFATRTGLWASSVHAFINMSGGMSDDAGARLAAIFRGAEGMADLARLLALAWALPALILLRRAASATRGASRLLLRAHLALTALLLVAALLDPARTLDALAALARLVGNVADGALLLAALWTSIPLVAWLLHEQDEPPTPGMRAQLPREPTLVRAAVALLALWAVVTLILLVRGVEGTQRVVYDARLPLIALPITLVALAAFAQRALGRTRALLAILTSLAAGLLVLVFGPARDLAGRLASLDAGLLAGLGVLALWSAARASRAIERLARASLLLAGLALLALSTSPPPFVAGLTIPAQAAPVGIVASLSLLALAFFPARGGWRRWAHGAHAGSVPLLHVGVALVFLGFGLSTYLSTEATFTRDAPILLGQTVDVGGGYALTFTGSDGQIDPAMSSPNETVYASVTTHFLLTRDGKPLGDAPLRMYFVEAKDHYDPSSLVLRQPDGDLYLNANFANAHAMYSDADGWVVGHGPTTHMTSAQITKIAMTVRYLPYVNVLWAGLWLLVAAGTARTLLPLVTTRAPAPGSAPHDEEDPAPSV